MNATHPRLPAQRPDRVTLLPCPLWCQDAGHHAPDFPDGARVHSARVGAWGSVVQVEAPGGWLPAAVAVDDLELSAENALALACDLVTAAGLLGGAQ